MRTPPHRLRLPLLAGAAVFATVAAWTLLATPRYRSSALVRIRSAQEGPSLPDALGDLLRFLRDAPVNDALLADLAGDLADLNQKLPGDLNEGPEPLRLDQPATIAALLPEVEALLTSRLLNQEAS